MPTLTPEIELLSRQIHADATILMNAMATAIGQLGVDAGLATQSYATAADTASALAHAAMWSGNTSGLAQNETKYFAPAGASQTPAASNTIATSFIVARATTMRNLYVYCDAPAGTDTTTVTVLKNGTDTALTVTITGAATAGHDTADTVAFAAGDLVSVKIDTSATSATASLAFGFDTL